MPKIIKKKCSSCKRELAHNLFYKINSPMFPDGMLPMCSDCFCADVKQDSIPHVKEALFRLDLPYIRHLWESHLRDKKGNPFRRYVRCVKSLHQYKGKTWKDSDELTPETTIVEAPCDGIVSAEISEKWGHGYKYEEYEAFEKKYQLLKPNYPEKTAMHTEALLNYIRYRVKEEMATARGNVTDAEKWGKLAKDAATNAKINPSQLTKADLLDGLDGFGQLTKAVEQAVDIIPILPKFRERPQDKVDFTLLCYINYIRSLKGIPECSYEDIWKFYDERVNNYKDTFDFLTDDMAGDKDG